LSRTASVEHTVNPFNRNEAGEVRTAREVAACAQLEADKLAAKLAAEPAVCRDCEEAPQRTLLLAMAAEPDRVFPAPERYWGSPMQTLADRKQVESAYAKCECGAPCCSGYSSLGGYRVTRLGMARAAKLVPTSAEASS
jgi:hypothetical protein